MSRDPQCEDPRRPGLFTTGQNGACGQHEEPLVNGIVIYDPATHA